MKVKTRCVYSILALLLSLTINGQAQTRPADVQGWLDARWGMSADELRKTFGASIEQVPKGDYFVRNDDTRYGYTGFVVRDFTLVDGKFTVKLVMDVNTDRLIEIYIAPSEDKSPLQEIFFSRLDAALTQKYGRPDFSTEGRPSRERKWFFQTTTIELSLVQLAGYTSLTLTYKPPKSERV